MSSANSIVTRFEEVASRSPESCAMRWNGGEWSYAALNTRANRLAHFLIGAGIQEETPVGVFAQRSPETLAAFLAILKAGGAYVPLDPLYPAERIKYYIEDAAIKLVLADPVEISKLPAISAEVIALDADLAAKQPETNPNCPTGPHSLAHILFTSGSTGRPKGVLIEHQGVLRLTNHIDYMDIGPGEIFLQYAPLSFDISTFEIWGPLLNGACLALPPPGLTSLHELGAAIRSLGITSMTLTAGLMALMVEQEIDSLAGVRQLLTGGDVVSPVHAERFLRKYPGSRLINAYGPTENSVLTSCHSIQLENPMPTRLSIGRPIQKTGVLILNENLQQVPAGELGEMVMTGEGVARGYLNQPELTAQSFVEVTDSSGKKVRGYRSGDLGRYNRDGTLDFQGRMDDQVKINGLRIEPGEITNVLQSHPQVSGAEVVVVDSEGEGKKRLEAFVVLRSENSLDERALREFLSDKIPSNWLPSALRIVPGLPLGPNGKVDRRALLASLHQATRLPAVDAKEPDDFLEKAIWSIWQEILPGVSIGKHDSFSELGGDSLAALDMIARVEKMIGRTIGLRPLLEGGTIHDIAVAARDTGPVSPPPLMICMQSGTTAKPPFFFAHGDYVCGGLYCQKMAHRLGVEQPLYAIAPHGTFGEDLPSSFEEAASSYVKMIRSVQPKGPYHLGGFCNGAVAMYEVAQQLIRTGDTVATLVLLDPPDLYFFLLRRRITQFGKFIGLPDRQSKAAYQRIAEGIEVWQYHGFLRVVKDFWVRLGRWVIKKFRGIFEIPSATSAPNLNFHYYELLASYEPQPYLGSKSVWIILRQGENHRRAQQVSYWAGFISGPRFQVIPGTHLELKGSMKEITHIVQTALKHDA
jgi:amino acid adenylation domain-containing protein